MIARQVNIDVDQIIVTLSIHGYHGVRHLSAMLKYQQQEAKWKEYCATVLWSVGKMLCSEEYPIPAYSDYINPKPVDKRTSKDIVNSLIDRLGRREMAEQDA